MQINLFYFNNIFNNINNILNFILILSAEKRWKFFIYLFNYILIITQLLLFIH